MTGAEADEGTDTGASADPRPDAGFAGVGEITPRSVEELFSLLSWLRSVYRTAPE